MEQAKLTEEEMHGFYSTCVDAPSAAEQASSGHAPWTGCVCLWCCADKSDGEHAAQALRDQVREEDGFRQYVAAARVSVDPNSESCWPCSFQFGEVGVYRAVLPKTARLVVSLPPWFGPTPLLQSSVLPFEFDGQNFRASDEAFVGDFSAAMVSILSLLPAPALVAHLLSGSYLSTRKFMVTRTGQGGGLRTPASYADVVAAIIHHRLRQEFDTQHET